MLLLFPDRMFGSDFDYNGVWCSSWIARLLPLRAMVAQYKREVVGVHQTGLVSYNFSFDIPLLVFTTVEWSGKIVVANHIEATIYKWDYHDR